MKRTKFGEGHPGEMCGTNPGGERVHVPPAI